MRWLFWLFWLLFLFVSCEQEPQKVFIEVEDTTKLNLIRNFINLQEGFDTISTQDKALQKELEDQSKYIDTLIRRTLDYRSIELDYVVLEDEYTKIMDDKDTLQKRVTAAEQENKELHKANKELKYEIRKEKAFSKAVIIQKNKLEQEVKEASRTHIASVKVAAYGYSGGFFGDQKRYETTKASKIKTIMVEFTIPENRLADKGKKVVNIRLYSNNNDSYIEKERIIKYNGKEERVDVHIEPTNLVHGGHRILLTMDGNIEYDSIFSVSN